MFLHFQRGAVVYLYSVYGHTPGSTESAVITENREERIGETQSYKLHFICTTPQKRNVTSVACDGLPINWTAVTTDFIR